MSQGLNIVRPRRGFKMVGTLFAIAALMLQPLVTLNIPSVFAVDAQPTVDGAYFALDNTGFSVGFIAHDFQNVDNVTVDLQKSDGTSIVKNVGKTALFGLINGKAAQEVSTRFNIPVARADSNNWDYGDRTSWTAADEPVKAVITLNGVALSEVSGYTINESTPTATFAALLPAPVGPVKNVNSTETFSTIQAAIDDDETLPGHVIEAAPGDYNESVKVNKSLTIKGAQAGVDPRPSTSSSRSAAGVNESAIVAQRSQNAILISAPNVVIDGFVVKQTGGSGNARTIETAIGYEGIALRNNIVTTESNGSAMHLYGGTNFLIENNYLTGIPGEGIVLRNGNLINATNQKIVNNEIDNQFGVAGGAIYTYGQSGLEIAGNLVYAKYQGLTIGVDGPVHYKMNNINVHDNAIYSELATGAVQKYAVMINGDSDGITIKHNTIAQAGAGTDEGTNYALIKVGYDNQSAAQINPTNLVITENNLKRNVSQPYLDVATAVSNPINAGHNWWNDVNGPADKVNNSSSEIITTSPWLCGPFETDPAVSNNGSCKPADIVKPSIPNATLKDNDGKPVTDNGYINNDSNKFTFTLNSTDNEAVTKYNLIYWNEITGDRYQGEDNAWPSQVGANGVYPDKFSRGEGVHHFKFNACNAAGNCSEYSQAFTVTYDKTDPAQVTEVAVYDGANKITSGYTNKASVATRWTAVPDAAKYEYCYWNSISTSTIRETNCYKQYPTSNSQPGTYNQGEGENFVKVRAIDAAGNIGPWSETVSVIYDKTIPVTNITSATASGNSLSFNGSVSDTNLRYYYCYMTTNQTVVIDGHTFTAGQEVRLNSNADSSRDADCVTKWAKGQTNIDDTLGGFNITGVPSGDYTVNLVAYDFAGNNNVSTPERFVVSVDHTSPVLTINSIADSTDTTPTITGTTTDKNSPVFVDGQEATIDAANPNADGTFNWSVTLTARSTGEHVISAASQDAAGNAASPVSETFNVQSTVVSRSAAAGGNTAARINLVGPASVAVATLGNGPLALNLANIADTTDTTDATADDQGETLGVSDKKSSGDNKGDVLAATDDKSGCGKFLGLCWYWWIPIAVAVLGAIWFYLASRRESDPDPFSGPARRQ